MVEQADFQLNDDGHALRMSSIHRVNPLLDAGGDANQPGALSF